MGAQNRRGSLLLCLLQDGGGVRVMNKGVPSTLKRYFQGLNVHALHSAPSQHCTAWSPGGLPSTPKGPFPAGEVRAGLFAIAETETTCMATNHGII